VISLFIKSLDCFVLTGALLLSPLLLWNTLFMGTESSCYLRYALSIFWPMTCAQQTYKVIQGCCANNSQLIPIHDAITNTVMLCCVHYVIHCNTIWPGKNLGLKISLGFLNVCRF